MQHHGNGPLVPSGPGSRSGAFAAAWGLGLLALLALPFAAAAREPGGAAGAPATPRSLGELGAALDRIAERHAMLVERAQTHPGVRILEVYEAYEPDDFRAKKRQVEAKDVAEILFPGGKDKERPVPPVDLRERALKALMRPHAAEHDPDLNSVKTRRRFALKYVVPQLVNEEDGHSRRLAHALLVAWYPGPATNAQIQIYDPRATNKRDWKDAETAWKNELRKL